MTEIKTFYIYKMLFIISRGMPIDELIEKGLEYSQIAEIITHLLKLGLISDEGENGLLLTDIGREQLNNFENDIFPNISNNRIPPLISEQISKIDKFDIYLPKRKSIKKKPYHIH